MFISQWTGVGISKVPEKERMLPHMSQKSSLKDCKVVHPDEVGLEGMSADEDVIACCGKQILLFYNDDQLCDFVWYNAFSEGLDGDFAQLVKYSKSCTGVQPIHRGGKFAYWSSGQMIPFGARQPSGGRRADYYTFYAGIEANTHKGIKILFEQAQISAIMIRTAKAIHPALVTEIQENSKDCEKVGVFGQSLFHCTGYTAPQHSQNGVNLLSVLYNMDTTLKLGPICCGVSILDFYMVLCYHQNKLSYVYEEVLQEAQDVTLLQDNEIAIEQREYNRHAEDITHVKQLGTTGD
ncbi:hypothetical protein F5880DRAFT_1619439 [Lentinula raphanica]|nr:hypothetical protein F5880DRAFT_1619439 [Lentinula raphanica]